MSAQEAAISDNKGTPTISVVVPIYNEAGSAAPLHREIVAAMEALERSGRLPGGYEILYIDDGSTDGTAAACRSLSPLKYIRLKRNSGQTAAMDCGFRLSAGEYVASLDGDGQNDPADIGLLLDYLLSSGLDAVCGWRRTRRDPLPKRVFSRGAYLLRQLFLHDGIHDSGCTLKLCRRACVENVRLVRGQHRFIPALLLRHGFTVGEREVHHRARETGKSKYNFTRVFDGLRDMLAIWCGRADRVPEDLGYEVAEVRVQ